MNDKFAIMCFQVAQDAVHAHPNNLNVISIGTWGVSLDLCKNVLFLDFEDLDTEKELYPQYKYCQKQDVIDAIEFSKKHHIHIIHCHAGLSRSPAIGYAILRSEGYSKEDALKKILEKVPEAEPNKRIVKFADELF